jgi:hypothetical protein
MGTIGSRNASFEACRAAALTCARAILIAALVLTSHYGCSADRGPDTPSRRAREFYQALNTEDFDGARRMLTGEEHLARLLSRYGGIGAWGDRVTKNGIVSQLHATERATADGNAQVEMIVMFHDGTRRRDHLTLTRTANLWRVDAESVPGNELHDGP